MAPPPAISAKSPTDELYVVCVYSNPAQYKSRPRLFREFVARVPEGVNLVIVEASFGERGWELARDDNPLHFRVRVDSELWIKESLINYAVARLPATWKYVAWVDADVMWARDDWPSLTVEALQHHPVVQMWQHCVDLGPTTEALGTHTSFAASWRALLAERGGDVDAATRVLLSQPKHVDAYGRPSGPGFKGGVGTAWHTGYAWAMTRDAFEAVGGLIDIAIVGSADHHMARALVGVAGPSLFKGIHEHYRRIVLAWQARALEHLKRDLGFLPVTILHHWHGKKGDRGYATRSGILLRNRYDPLVDIKRTWDGIVQLAGHKHELRDDIRAYFRSRNEDSVDV